MDRRRFRRSLHRSPSPLTWTPREETLELMSGMMTLVYSSHVESFRMRTKAYSSRSARKGCVLNLICLQHPFAGGPVMTNTYAEANLQYCSLEILVHQHVVLSVV
jgi:hypothetical protein